MSALVAAPGVRCTVGYRCGHRGTVLALDDPRSWAGSLAFPDWEPGALDRRAVTAHVLRCLETVPKFAESVPVLWSFGKVYWEKCSSLEVA